jgi:hypothetical protein
MSHIPIGAERRGVRRVLRGFTICDHPRESLTSWLSDVGQRITTKLGSDATVLDPARGGKYRFKGANRNRGKELRDAYSDAYGASRLRTSQRAANAKRDVRIVGRALLQRVELTPQPKGRAGAPRKDAPVARNGHCLGSLRPIVQVLCSVSVITSPLSELFQASRRLILILYNPQCQTLIGQ